MKKMIAALSAAAMLVQAPVFAEQTVTEGSSLKVGDYAESAAETQKLIDERPDIQRFSEDLNRGLIAVMADGYGFISWRWQGYESLDVKYNLYKNGERLNTEPLSVTNYTDISAKSGDRYQVAPVTDGTEGEKCDEVTILDTAYFDIPIQKPEDSEVNGETYSYSANDASAADLDGDGELEIVLKWDPSNSKDAAQTGFTGECIIDAYKLDGTRLWRINMGKNIRSGAHDTQFMVYDFDGDGAAEMVCRTADGTVAGDGTVIGDATKDYAALNDGKNLTGPLYLTAFKGSDGSVIDTVEYDPQTYGDGYDMTDWGDGYGNRSERYLAGIGSFDGDRVGFIFCRGYYTGSEGPLGGRTVMAAYNLVDGKIEKLWRFDTKELDNQYIGQGNHSMTLADVDYDGCDEVIYGSLAVDHDGKVMYSTGLGHGDSQHVSDILPSRPGLEVFSCHEDSTVAYSYELRDARTGEILSGGEQLGIDNGRACAADIDPAYEGEETWSAAGVLMAADGTVISTDYTMAANFLNWWDGDLGREIQDSIYIQKWDPEQLRTDTIFTATDCMSVNGTKSVPSLTADLFGDWREETIYPLKDSSALRVFTTAIPTGYRIPTLLSDTQYRNHVALQNTCYNQPTHLSYYLGYGTETVPVPQIYVDRDGEKVTNPDLERKAWSIDELYFGESVKLVANCPTALVNGVPKRIDNDDANVVPVINSDDRTMVPIRFIAEAFNAQVDWDADAQLVTISKDGKTIEMPIGSSTFTVDGVQNTMDTAAVIENDRTLVPLRAVSEALALNVFYYDGLIVVSDLEVEMTDEAASAERSAIESAPVPERIVPAAINTGEKFYPQQLDVFAVTASDNDGNLEVGAVDLDMGTRWSAFGANTLTIDLGSVQGVTGVAIAMWKGAERIYPFTIEYSTDGETWETALEKTENSGTTEDFEEYMFGSPVYARYIRYSGDGATDPEKNYCHISEIAVLGVQ